MRFDEATRGLKIDDSWRASPSVAVPQVATLSRPENVRHKFLFLKREEEAWVCKTVLGILNFCFVSKIWLGSTHFALTNRKDG